MPTIALIHDTKSDRDSLARNFHIALPENWRCIPIAPLQDPSGYGSWIVKEQVQVMVLDWLLNEQKEDVQHPVTYMGQTVVAAVRRHFPNMPVFVITALPPEDLREHLGDVEGVFTRKEFSAAPKALIKPILRAGERFAVQFQKDLSELTELSKKVAAGQAKQLEIERLRALQATLGLASDLGQEISRADALGRFEVKLKAMESLCDELRAYLKRKPSK